VTISDANLSRIVGCRSDFEIGSLLGQIQIDGFAGLTELSAESLKADSPDPDAKAKRFELITAIRGGKHVELSTAAYTFRQRKTPNRRGLRLAADKLESRAGTWKGLPFLTDHDTYSMTASKGTILSSKLVQESASVAAFEQVLHVVKPETVIGVLDGTVCKFSIGWFPIGPVLCTLHNVDVRSSGSCSCWPLMSVVVDGKTRIAEYEFSDYEGKETSTVVVPAVKDTSISDVRAALAAELDIHPTRTRTIKENTMRFQRLAAVLRLAALDAEADEAHAVLAVEALQRRATDAETSLATAQAALTGEKTKVTQLETALGVAVAAGNKIKVDAALEAAYAKGKLRRTRDAEGNVLADGREVRLRRIASDATHGLTELTAELAALDVIVPVGRALQSGAVGAPPPTPDVLGTGFEENPYVAGIAAQLGLKPEDMIAFQRDHLIGEG
jgi:hypothetical protein